MILCLAGPGSGKSTTLVNRISRLILTKADPSKMVALTFTNAAARELEHKLEGYTRLGYTGTLHGFALKMLKEHGLGIGYGERMSIVSPESAETLLASKAKQVGCKTKLADLMKWKQKGRPATMLHDPHGIAAPVRLRLCKEDLTILAYYDELADAGIVDFDVLLEEFHRLIWAVDLKGLFTDLFVDEVQDSARLDWKIYKGLPIPNKFLVGDSDQAIYSFRGGEVGEMLKFAKEPGVTLIPLEANFRSHSEICQAAQRLIEHNRDRFPKSTISAKGDGGIVTVMEEFYNEGEEIAAIVRRIQAHYERCKTVEKPPESIAILVRNNFLLTPFAQALTAAGVPVIENERSDLPQDWPACRALIELLVQPTNDSLAFFYLIAKLKVQGATIEAARDEAHSRRLLMAKEGQPLGEKLLGFFHHFPSAILAPGIAQAQGMSLESRFMISDKLKELDPGASMLDLALELGQARDRIEKPLETEGVTVSTIHGAKGREWDAVFIAGLEDEITPGTRKNTNVEEERRLLYVAVTRARKVLHLSFASSRIASWGPVVDHTPSRFIKEMLP